MKLQERGDGGNGYKELGGQEKEREGKRMGKKHKKKEEGRERKVNINYGKRIGREQGKVKQ
jgi:hypothetical protein